MKIEIEKKDFIVTVNVSLTPRKSTAKMVSYDTGKVLEWLKNNHPDCEIEEILQKPAVSLHNSLGLDRLEGKWLFSLVKPEEAKTIVVKKSTKKKTTRKKTTKSINPSVKAKTRLYDNNTITNPEE